MGQLLDRWMQENSRSLQALAPVPQMAPPTAPAFGAGAQAPGAPPAFPSGAGPMAAPVNVQNTPGAEVGNFGPFQAPQMTPVAFPEPAQAGGGPGAGTQVMDAMEERRRTQEEEGSIPGGTAGPGGIVAEGREAPETEEGEIRMPAEGEAFSAQDAMDQTPEAVDKAVDELERTTGVPVEQTYEQVTGNPPPQNMKRRQMGSFLFEFGLNLMAAPAGVSDVETFGGALQQTMAGRAGRATTAAAAEREERQAQHDRRMELADYGLKRREIESVEAGRIERFVSDGKMYQWDPVAGTATPVLGADGEPITGIEGQGTGTQAEYMFTATLENHEAMANLAGVEFTPELQIKAREAAAEAMRGIRPAGGRSDQEMRRSAEESARGFLSDTPEFLGGTPEERDAMIRAAQTKAFNWEKYGQYSLELPAGPDPDPEQIPEGSAVPVTDEHGRTNYWVRQTDPESGQVRARKLTPAEVRELQGG